MEALAIRETHAKPESLTAEEKKELEEKNIKTIPKVWKKMLRKAHLSKQDETLLQKSTEAVSSQLTISTQSQQQTSQTQSTKEYWEISGDGNDLATRQKIFGGNVNLGENYERTMALKSQNWESNSKAILGRYRRDAWG